MPRVLIVAYQGATDLDISGPAEVFSAAARHLGDKAYRVELASVGGGAVRTTSMLRVDTRDLCRVRPSPSDTIVVSGGGDEGALRAAIAHGHLLTWLKTAARIVERMTSVCSGSFILAEAGLLDGRRATTHWIACEQMARMYPRVAVDPNAIFVVDGKIWTSAGVATGIDMALAMVEQDHGRAVADAVAASMVLYIRRPGFQSQFSNSLVAQLGSSEPLGSVTSWIRTHLREADVETVAQRAGLSVRTLHRHCRERLGMTPAKLVDKLRVEHARTLLATSDLLAKDVADRCGFGTTVRMKRAFERELGMGPQDYRLLHSAGDA